MNPIILIGAALVGVGYLIGNKPNSDKNGLTIESVLENNSNAGNTNSMPQETNPDENQQTGVSDNDLSGGGDSPDLLGDEETPNHPIEESDDA